jgi:superfamily II DNA or RNA helicase
MIRKHLRGFHEEFASVLGLSATPEREYDDAGNEFIEQEIGPVLFQYAIEDAIKDRILCPFNYVVTEYELTDHDRQRLQQIFARSQAAAANGNPWPEEQLYRELSNVYKTAEEKPEVFRDLVYKQPNLLKATIIFVLTQEFGERLLDTIGHITTAYSTYFDDDPKARLNELSSRELDCLLCCKRLSEGIDIRHLRNVILLSSDRGRLQTIQRIGRTLRTDPEEPHKVANVADFVLRDAPVDHADRQRSDWLQWLSGIRP